MGKIMNLVSVVFELQTECPAGNVFVEGSLSRRNQRKRRSPGRQGGAPPGKRAGAGLLLG